MNKKNWLIIAIILVLVIGAGIFLYFKKGSTSNESNYEANRTSAENTTKETKENNNTNHTTENNTNDDNSDENQTNSSTTNNEIKQDATETKETPPVKEEQIATYTTKIYSNDSARQNNISITCKTINGTIVKNGATFSFCGTVGQSSTSKGYQKADIYDNDGNKKKGLGGGNCQISSTLYNAVLSVPTLVVTERHAHSNYVPYVAKGKDAAVAYGSYDLKFKNNSGNDIKILASTNGTSVTTTLLAIK